MIECDIDLPLLNVCTCYYNICIHQNSFSQSDKHYIIMDTQFSSHMTICSSDRDHSTGIYLSIRIFICLQSLILIRKYYQLPDTDAEGKTGMVAAGLAAAGVWWVQNRLILQSTASDWK